METTTWHIYFSKKKYYGVVYNNHIDTWLDQQYFIHIVAVNFISEGNRGKQPNKPQRNCITAVSTTPWHGRISSYTQWISRLKQILQNEYMTQIVVAKYLKCYVFLCLFRFDHVTDEIQSIHLVIQCFYSIYTTLCYYGRCL